MAEIGLAASVIAVIQISQSVITQAYKYGQAVKNATKDIERIQSEMKDIGNVLIKLRDLAHRAEKSGRSLDHWPSLVAMGQKGGPLSKCELSLNCLLTELSPVDGWARIKERALWPQKMKKLEKSLQTVTKEKKYFIEALNIEQAGGVLEIECIATDISKAQNDDNRDKILKWLSHTDPTINHIAARSKHEPQTGNWFIQEKEYSQWREMPSSFLWLHGIPGCGKTILCSTIIEDTISSRATKPDHSTAYFYFSFNDTEKQKTCNFLRSLLAQLARQKPRIPDGLQSLYNSYQHGQPPIDSLKTALRSVLEPAGQTFVLIDALDECPYGEERTQLSAILKDFSTWALPNLHILVTSRKEPDIDEALAPLLTFPPVCIQTKLVDADIRLHVKTQLVDDVNLKKWSPQIKGEIETALVEGANGMFRWVFCQLDSLKKCLKAATIRKALKSLPKTLHDTYARILLNIDLEYHQEAINALSWLAFSRRPLSIEELAEAAVINPQADPPFNPEYRLRDPHSILQILSSLVTISTRKGNNSYSGWQEPDEVDEIRLTHFSVKEYLTSDQVIPELASFRMTDVTANRAIAENSLLYIMSYDQAENKSSSDRDFDEFPLLQYACRLWFAHVITDQDVTPSSISSLIFKFFMSDSGFSSWLQVHKPDSFWYLPFSNEYDFASPLYYASYVGLYCVVKMLVEKGAYVNAQGGYYSNALQAASAEGHNQIVQLLLEKGADVNAQGGYYSNALQLASAEGHNQIVQLPLEKGADVNAQGGYYSNALQAASAEGHNQIVQLLLEKGADVNAQGGCYSNALQLASAKGHNQIVQLLLEKGADVNAQGGYYSNALQAASAEGHNQIVQLLLEKGADVNAQGGYFGNALQAASFEGHNQIVQLLLEKGADVNAQGGYFGNALQAASAEGHNQIVQLLLEKGADVNAQGGYFGNALQAASAGGHNQIVQLLLEKGADVNAQGGYYGTALQVASFGGHDQTVQLLLEKGAVYL